MYLKLINDIDPNKIRYSRDLVLVCHFQKGLSMRIGDDKVYVSEFVIAKILGYIDHLQGHPDVTRQFLRGLPEFLKNPKEIFIRNDRPNERYIICGTENHRVVLEIGRNGGVTEINTIHTIRESNLRKLRNKCSSL